MAAVALFSALMGYWLGVTVFVGACGPDARSRTHAAASLLAIAATVAGAILIWPAVGSPPPVLGGAAAAVDSLNRDLWTLILVGVWAALMSVYLPLSGVRMLMMPARVLTRRSMPLGERIGAALGAPSAEPVLRVRGWRRVAGAAFGGAAGTLGYLFTSCVTDRYAVTAAGGLIAGLVLAALVLGTAWLFRWSVGTR